MPLGLEVRGCEGNERGGHYDVGVEDKAEREHYRFFFFSVRHSLTVSSIWRGVSLLVPLPFDSSPMTRSTSGS